MAHNQPVLGIDDILRRDERLSMWHVVQSLTNMGFSKDEISDAIKRYVDSVCY